MLGRDFSFRERVRRKGFEPQWRRFVSSLCLDPSFMGPGGVPDPVTPMVRDGGGAPRGYRLRNI